ncbi:hypothetical protein GCM10020331_026140 [Ectobacillus funiculus]
MLNKVDFMGGGEDMGKILEGKVAFVTGAASGVGLQIVETFAAEGAKVILSDINEQGCKKMRPRNYKHVVMKY